MEGKQNYEQMVPVFLFLDGEKCPFPLQARPSMEGVGIDVYRLVTKVGWDIEEARTPREGGSGSPSNLTRIGELCRELWNNFMAAHDGLWSCFELQERFYGRRYDTSIPEIQSLKATGEYFHILSKHACNITAVGAKLTAEIILRERKIDSKLGKHRF